MTGSINAVLTKVEHGSKSKRLNICIFLFALTLVWPQQCYLFIYFSLSYLRHDIPLRLSCSLIVGTLKSFLLAMNSCAISKVDSQAEKVSCKISRDHRIEWQLIQIKILNSSMNLKKNYGSRPGTSQFTKKKIEKQVCKNKIQGLMN